MTDDDAVIDRVETDTTRRRQVVGIDGSPEAERALDWALARTDALGPVQPVAAWNYPWWATGVPLASPLPRPAEDVYRDVVVERIRTTLASRADAGVLDPVAIHGSAGDSLVRAAADAALLVVGTRGRGQATSALLGSVSIHCVNHAPVPVAVIPPTAPIEDRHDRVVVGIDGSDDALAALGWAIDHAPPAAKIEAVHAYGDVPVSTMGAVVATDAELRSWSEEVVAETLASVADRGRPVTGQSVAGDARLRLRDAAEGADLLVVGARGHSGLAHLLLGSVASAVAYHPTVATIVVR